MSPRPTKTLTQQMAQIQRIWERFEERQHWRMKARDLGFVKRLKRSSQSDRSTRSNALGEEASMGSMPSQTQQEGKQGLIQQGRDQDLKEAFNQMVLGLKDHVFKYVADQWVIQVLSEPLQEGFEDLGQGFVKSQEEENRGPGVQGQERASPKTLEWCHWLSENAWVAEGFKKRMQRDKEAAPFEFTLSHSLSPIEGWGLLKDHAIQEKWQGYRQRDPLANQAWDLLEQCHLACRLETLEDYQHLDWTASFSRQVANQVQCVVLSHSQALLEHLKARLWSLQNILDPSWEGRWGDHEEVRSGLAFFETLWPHVENHPDWQEWKKWVEAHDPSSLIKGLGFAFLIHLGELGGSVEDGGDSVFEEWQSLWSPQEQAQWDAFWEMWVRMKHLSLHSQWIADRRKGLVSEGKGPSWNQEGLKKDLVSGVTERFEKPRTWEDCVSYGYLPGIQDLVSALALRSRSDDCTKPACLKTLLEPFMIDEFTGIRNDSLWMQWMGGLPGPSSDLFDPWPWKVWLGYVKRDPRLLEIPQECVAVRKDCEKWGVEAQWLAYWRKNSEGWTRFYEETLPKWGSNAVEEHYRALQYEAHLKESFGVSKEKDAEKQKPSNFGKLRL